MSLAGLFGGGGEGGNVIGSAVVVVRANTTGFASELEAGTAGPLQAFSGRIGTLLRQRSS